MKNKKFVLTILFITIFGFAVFILWQYSLYQAPRDISCEGDWSYWVKCPIGTYCRSLGQGPLAGGLCQPYLSPIFDLLMSPKTETPVIPAENPTPPAESPVIPPMEEWKMYEVEWLGISYKLPPSVRKLLCDQATCYSRSTTLPGGTRFTLASHGKDQILGGSWEQFEAYLRDTGLTIEETNMRGKIVNKFFGTISKEAVHYFAPYGGKVEGFMIRLNEDVFIDVSIAAGEVADNNFLADQVLFSQILSTFSFP